MKIRTMFLFWVNGDHEETLQLKKGKSYTL